MKEVGSFREVEGDDAYIVKMDKDGDISLGFVQSVYISANHYIVYLDNSDNIWYANDSTLDKVGEQFNTLWNRIQAVKSLPMHNALEFKDSIYRSLATAISCGLDGDFTTANDAVQQAKTTLISSSQRRAKIWYMPTATIVGLIMCAVGIYLYNDSLSYCVGDIYRTIAVSVMGGSVGALLSSLAPRAGKSFDPYATKASAMIDAVLRIIYGIITAFIVTLAVEVQFITSSALTNDETRHSLILVAIAGGFLERWATDIIRQIRPSKSN